PSGCKASPDCVLGRPRIYIRYAGSLRPCLSRFSRARSAATSPRLAPRGLVAPVPLLAPRVAVVVVAECLPEAGLVLLRQAQSPHPLGALPEIEMGNEHPCRPAVLRLQRLPAVAEGDP